MFSATKRGASRSSSRRSVLDLVKLLGWPWIIAGVSGCILIPVVVFILYQMRTTAGLTTVDGVLEEKFVQPEFEFYTVLPSDNIKGFLFGETSSQNREEKIFKVEESGSRFSSEDSGKYYVLKTGIFDFDKVKALYLRLVSIELEPSVLRVQTQDRYRYRIRLGPFKSKKMLNAVQNKLLIEKIDVFFLEAENK